jgi:hypothetical protein
MPEYLKRVVGIAAIAVVALSLRPAGASTYLGELPVGYSDSFFQIGAGTSSLGIDINARVALVIPRFALHATASTPITTPSIYLINRGRFLSR